MKESRYNLSFPSDDGSTLLYNSYRNTLTSAEPGEWPEYPEENEQALAAQGLLIPDEKDELRELRRSCKIFRYDAGTMLLSIMPTMDCNFRCDYCYEASHCGSGIMNDETAGHILAFVRRSAASLKLLHVAWYGGEPLLGIQRISSLSAGLLSLCAEHGIRYSASIVTNGYLLSSGTLNALEKAGVGSLQVTLDGDREYHDTRRILADGRGTFDRIMENLHRLLDESRLCVNIRINVDVRNTDGIPPLLARLCKEGFAGNPRFRVYFAPVQASTEACASISCQVLQPETYSEMELDFLQKAVALGLASPPYPGRFNGICAAVRPYGFVILPNGDVHKCWHTVSDPEETVCTTEELAEGEDIKSRPNCQKWLDYSPFEEKCRECSLLPCCTGACPYKHLISRQDPCPSIRYNLGGRLKLFSACKK